jgi:hypothetical protein
MKSLKKCGLFLVTIFFTIIQASTVSLSTDEQEQLIGRHIAQTWRDYQLAQYEALHNLSCTRPVSFMREESNGKSLHRPQRRVHGKAIWMLSMILKNFTSAIKLYKNNFFVIIFILIITILSRSNNGYDTLLCICILYIFSKLSIDR